MKLLIKRDVLANIGTLDVGRLYLATDTYDLYLGTSDGNKLVGDSSLATDYLKIDASNDPITGTLTIQNSVDAQELIIKAKSGQTANLQEWQNSSGTVLSAFNQSGWLGVGKSPSYQFEVNTAADDSLGIAYSVNSTLYLGWKPNGQSIAYQNQDFSWQNGTPRVDRFVLSTTTQQTYIPIQNNIIGLTIRANASQTANLQEWQNSAGTVLSYVDATGGALFGDKVRFTQTDGNEYIDSLNDGYMDYGATTLHRFNQSIDVTGNCEADTYSVGGLAGIDKTITVLDADGTTTHQLVFSKGILTACTTT